MSQWADPERWARMRSGSDCPICRAGAPRDIVAELEVSWVTAGADDPIGGYACLVFRRHAAGETGSQSNVVILSSAKDLPAPSHALASAPT